MRLANPLGTIGPSLAGSADFRLLERELSRDIRSSIQSGLNGGVALCGAGSPLSVFQQSLAVAIGRIHEDGRALLFLRFLKDGPYEGSGRIPRTVRGTRLTDDETSAVITFVYAHMVNCFKGAIAEMLAISPCLSILRTLKSEQKSLRKLLLFAGDSVLAARRRGVGFAKGADFHILSLSGSSRGLPSVALWGIAEVKSYIESRGRLERQLDQHLSRARRGLQIGKEIYRPSQILLGGKRSPRISRIAVMPSQWTLPRGFHFESKNGHKYLHIEPGTPPTKSDTVERFGPNQWRIVLRWSREALEAAAYGMTFWFMEKVGEALYSEYPLPKGWEGMTPGEAGCNAAKMMLYYAILRCRTARHNQRAVALYNSYCFGYALGMNFRDPKGRREMLWPQDLDEMLESGVTRSGCRIK